MTMFPKPQKKQKKNFQNKNVDLFAAKGEIYDELMEIASLCREAGVSEAYDKAEFLASRLEELLGE